MFQKRRFTDRSPAEKVAIGLVLAISLTIVGFAERDIQRRPEEGIRGPKLLWRVVSMNALGALAYLGVGRR